MASDPIGGSLGIPKKLIPEIDVDAVIQNDLTTRGAVNFKPELSDDVNQNSDSIAWAEKSTGKKLVKYLDNKLSDSEKYDPTKAP